MLPVEWRDGWPVILDAGRAIPLVVPGPKFMRGGSQAPLSGNFTWRDEFDGDQLDFAWLQLRAPERKWFDLRRTRGSLTLEPQRMRLDDRGNPSFLGRRQQHLAFDASAGMTPPAKAGAAGGLVAFQNETHWFFLGVRRANGAVEVFLEKRRGERSSIVATAQLEPRGDVRLRISGQERAYSFFYADGEGGWTTLKEGEDGSTLSTELAGGFVGATLGPYARLE